MSPTRRAIQPSPDRALERDAQEQVALLETFLATTQHFFGDWTALCDAVQDPRAPQLITYSLAALLFTGTLMFLCRLEPRRHARRTHLLRRNGASAAKFQALFDVASCSHGDTLNATFRRLDPDQAQEVLTDLVRTLIRK